MWEDIRIGDRVRTKQGGPVMVVEASSFDGAVYCYWIERGKIRKAIFFREDLVMVERPRPSDPALRPGATSNSGESSAPVAPLPRNGRRLPQRGSEG